MGHPFFPLGSFSHKKLFYINIKKKEIIMKIGIDLGGSHIAVGVIDNKGIIVEKIEKKILTKEKKRYKKHNRKLYNKKCKRIFIKIQNNRNWNSSTRNNKKRTNTKISKFRSKRI